MKNYLVVPSNYFLLMVLFCTLPSDSEAFSQGSIGNLFYANFITDEFSYLNITNIGQYLTQDENDCGYACLEIPSCFSYNLAAFPDVNGKRLCELLPSDKYNNSHKFKTSKQFRHVYIASPCRFSPCKNSAKCIPLYKENGYKCICVEGFTGQNCETNINKCDNNTCLNNGTCIDQINAFNCSCLPGFAGNRCQLACVPLGVANASTIPDARITASTHFDINYSPYHGRLNRNRGRGAWCTRNRTSRTDYLQVDMGDVHSICAVATQGRYSENSWTTRYKLQLSLQAVNWYAYNENNVERVFSGNSDRNTVVKHSLKNNVKARFVRFYPDSYYNWPCLRVEIYVLK